MEYTQIVIYDKEELTKTLVESYIKDLTFPCKLQYYEEYNFAPIVNCDDFKIVIIDVKNADDDIINEISSFSNSKNIKIIAISYDDSANLQVKALRAGAKDFLVKPLVKNDFLNALQFLSGKYILKTQENANAKILTAISGRRGDGKTVFLINLAKELADKSGEKVLIVDFNTSQDYISFLLNASIAHNTNYYINNLTQENAQALLSSVTEYKNSTLYIMANGFFKNKYSGTKSSRLKDCINILKKYYSYIIMDKTFDNKEIDDELLVNFADDIFCIITPFIGSFEKIKNIYDNFNKEKNIKVILNQYTPADNTKIEQIQSLLGLEVFWKIPKNYSVVNNALNSNLTLKETAEDTDIVQTYKELAEFIVNRE